MMHNACNMCNVMFRCLLYIIWMLAGINQVISFEIPCNLSTSTVEIVEQCPADEKSYKEAESRKNCSSISHPCVSFDYHCVMNAWRNATVEVCAPSLFIIGGVCAEYSMHFMSIRSSVRSCQNFSEPCPSRYKSTEQYNYTECYDIANTANTAVSDGNRLSAGEITGIVLIAVLVFFICLSIAFFVYVRGKMIKKNKSFKQVIAAIPFCCQCVYEGSIMLKIQDFMDKRYGRVDVCDPDSQSTLAVTPNATSSVPLLSSIGNGKENKTTDSQENCEKQVLKNEDECDVSLHINTQQHKTSFLQNQPATSWMTTTAQLLELKSGVHPSIEHFIPPSTSDAQNFNSSSASPLVVSLQPDQQSGAGSSVSGQSYNKPLKSPHFQQIHQNTRKTDQLVSSQNSSSTSALDQPQDTSYNTLQSEPVDRSISFSEVEKSPLFHSDKDPSDSFENHSLDFTPVSVPTDPSEKSPYDSQNSSTEQSPEGTKTTSSLSSSTLHGSGDSETPRKKCVLAVPPEGSEASDELVSTDQTGLQPEHSKSGKRQLAVVNPQKRRPELSTSEGAEGGVLTDQMHGDNTEGSEASDELVSTDQTGLQPEHSKSGKRQLAVVNPQKRRPELSTSEGAEGGVLTDQMHGDNTVPSRTTRPSGFQDQRDAGSDQRSLEDIVNKRFDRIEMSLMQEFQRSEERYQLVATELHVALQKIKDLEKKTTENETEINRLLTLLDSRDRELNDRDRELERKDAEKRELERQLDQLRREKERLEREKEAEQRKWSELQRKHEKIENDVNYLKAEMEKNRKKNEK
ncbi:histone-lysine N-methyltransferase, H3 lysine-79 specific-like isoform X2 [Saccostrea cucullata]|uniref:histone-lysine N-methyltransferase, H3 lysine-79 specific-like isoform X2 n=1 Tax=Saccostrea cuccullata TaxID=36930 RepID=UPI002ED131AD